MFHSSEREETSSTAKPIAPSVLIVALLVNLVSAPAIAAPAPIPSWSFTYFWMASWNGARLRGAGLGGPPLAIALAVAAAVVAIVAVAGAVSASRSQPPLRLLQIRARPLAVQVVLLDVVLRLRPHRDALVELHHQEPHR